ncbi:TPA: hypothetical protein DCG86_00835 [Candidatus Marinimicrobia bacterium]|nr:MAG: nitroreductase [Marinimicrobia bacterium 46_43]HAE86550.1 hypothetical protein [Candidatus Neomarinimicrobiota bacterium]HBY18201.1 hypothetical protein [Candidatus Neomarinimicrobiota bacterium]
MNTSLISIDKDRCTSCGFCADVCPAGVLTLREGFPAARHPSSCIFCGHCAAVCPEDAFTHRGEETGKFTLKIPETDNPEDFYATRRSIRHYTSQKVESDILQKLIYLAETAPSGHNVRKRQYHVVDLKAAIDKVEAITARRYRQLAALINPVVTGFLSVVAPRKACSLLKDRNALKRLLSAWERGHHPFFRGAPYAIFISAPKKQRTGREDCIAAQQILILNAHRLGLGTCIIGYALYAHKELEKFLNLPKNRRIYAVIVLGYPKYSYRKAIYRGLRIEGTETREDDEGMRQ